jgi:hypothetical protein
LITPHSNWFTTSGCWDDVGRRTVRTGASGDTIGLLFDGQQLALARTISDAFELRLT